MLKRFYSYKPFVRPNIAFKFKSIQEKEKNKKHDILEASRNLKYTEEQDVRHRLSLDLFDVHSNSTKSKLNRDILYGIYPVLLSILAQRRTFKNFYYKKDILNKNDKVQEIFNLCKLHNIPSYGVDRKKLISLTGKDTVHQGVCLEASGISYIVLDNSLKDWFHGNMKGNFWLYLDQINDPMNMGAILRSAYYLGVNKVFTSKLNSCPLTNVVSKASSGVAEIYPVYQVTNEDHLFNLLQEHDWQIISSSTESKTSVPLELVKLKNNVILIVGNEGKGISKSLESRSDVSVNIPPQANCSKDVGSLNVSVASAILIHTLKSKLKANT